MTLKEARALRRAQVIYRHYRRGVRLPAPTHFEVRKENPFNERNEEVRVTLAPPIRKWDFSYLTEKNCHEFSLVESVIIQE